MKEQYVSFLQHYLFSADDLTCNAMFTATVLTNL